jgi:hypothetical protein
VWQSRAENEDGRAWAEHHKVSTNTAIAADILQQAVRSVTSFEHEGMARASRKISLDYRPQVLGRKSAGKSMPA